MRTLIALTLIVIFCIAPVAWIVKTSFETPQFIRNPDIQWYPIQFTLRNYEQVAGYRNIWTGIKNSVLVGAGSATVATILCLVAAFIIVRTKVKGRQSLDHILTVPIVIPGTVLGLAVTVRPSRSPEPEPFEPFPADADWTSLFDTHHFMDAVLRE